MNHPSSRMVAAGAAAALPWYRYPLVWMLIAIPMSSVIVGLSMLTVSIKTYDGLVVDDYYKRGLQINRRIARDEQATRLGLGARLALDPTTVRLDLRAGVPGNALPPELVLRLSHATRGGLDRTATLRETVAGTYAGPGLRLEPGRWYVEVGTPAWRLTTGLDASAPVAELTSGR